MGLGTGRRFALRSPRYSRRPNLESLEARRMLAGDYLAGAISGWVTQLDEPHDARYLDSLLGHGRFDVSQTPLVKNAYIIRLPNQPVHVDEAEHIAVSLSRAHAVADRYPLVARQQATRLIPNDPLFARQWHLNNTGQTGGTAGEDVNVTSVWDSFTGAGVVIGVVDDGLQYTHPDLAPNYLPNASFDFNDDDNDPAPDVDVDFHGTAVAGIAAAAFNNNVGVVGAAPEASLAGLRLIAAPTDDADEAAAFAHQTQAIDIYSNSWGPPDDGLHLEKPGPLTLAALQDAVETGRGGLGSILVFAAGNGKQEDDNVNYDGYANSRFTIAVSALEHNGRQAFYSEPRAPVLIAAPAAPAGIEGTTTTDLVGDDGYSDGVFDLPCFAAEPDADYTRCFQGTSAAAPMAAGLIALLLEANPTLTWRDVQHVLVHSARQNDPLDAEWTVNAAGHPVSHKYGFGAIDAESLIATGLEWQNVVPEVLATTGLNHVSAAIPDNDASGIRSTVRLDDVVQVESVEVVFNAMHPRRGDLEVVLTSPGGTDSVLTEVHGDEAANYSSWALTSMRHWDELASGDWTLTVRDLAAGETGTFDDWTLNVYGTTVRAGIVQLDQDDYLVGEQVTVMVADSDIAGTGTLNIELATTGGDTENLLLTETSNGIFHGSVTSSLGIPAPNGNLEVDDGDVLTVTYHDTDDGTGSPAAATDMATFTRISRGTVGFDRGGYDPEDLATMSVTDTDLIGSGFVNVVLTSPSGDTETVVLTEQSAAIFTGTVELVTGEASADGILQVDPGTTISVRYDDADDGTGNPATAVDTAFIHNTACSSVEAFDGVIAPSLPAGWTTSSTSGNVWVTVDTGSDTSPNHAFVRDADGISDDILLSPVVHVDVTSNQLRFRHQYDTETTWDGGVLEISLNGEPFQDILDAGGRFEAGGYDSELQTIADNPLGGRQAWNGLSEGYIETLVTLPATLLDQDVQFRWRMGSDAAVGAPGWQVDSIQLCGAAVAAFDFGDAPDPTFPTVAANQGARHLLSEYFLGDRIDVEPDGQPSAQADGDDQMATDDEDGVVFTSLLTIGDVATVDVVASRDGFLNAWLDANGDGTWDSLEEHILVDAALVSGTNRLSFSVPTPGTAIAQTFARFRFSSEPGVGINGLALDGEVEDYPVSIAAGVGETETLSGFQPLLPLGSLIYSATGTGTVDFSGEVDTWSVIVDAPQTLSVVVRSAAALAASVEVRDPGSQLVGSAVAAGPGEDILISAIPVNTAGRFDITVAGSDDSVGDYTVEVYLNAGIEAESLGGSANDTATSAADIDGAFISVAGGMASRGAVVGSLDGASSEDWYRFSVAPGEPVSVALDSQATGSATLEIFDDSETLLARGVAADNVAQVINWILFQAPTPVPYYARVVGADADYRLVVTRGSDFDTEANDALADAPLLAGDAVVLGHVAHNNDDWFGLAAVPGDDLTVRTLTRADGVGEFANLLDPALELYDPSGQLVATDLNSAGDGRNALIAHSAAMMGQYRIRIFAENDGGEYTVSATGATGDDVPPGVSVTSPSAGEVTGSFPSTYTVQFSEPLLLSTLDASDLLVNGIPATGFTIVDGRTFAFAVDPASHTGDQEYQVSMSGAAVADLQGTATLAFLSTFVLDTAGPIITATQFNGASLPADRTLDAGALAFVASLNEKLNANAISLEDVTLLNTTTNDAHVAASVVYEPAADTLTADFDSLPEGLFALSLISGNDALEDQVGNDLDGEPLGAGADGTPSGDGTAGGDFTVAFGLDAVGPRATTDFVRLEPLGSLMARSDTRGAINFPGDVDEFTVAVNAGQVLSGAILPDSAIASVTIQVDGLSDVITSPSPGQPAALPPTFITTDAVLTIRVTGSEATSHTLRLGKNLVEEFHDAADGSELPVDDSFLAVGRYALVGHLDSVTDIDEFTVDLTPHAGQQVDIVLAGLDASFAAAALELLDLDGNSVLATASSMPLGAAAPNYDLGILEFAVPAAGVYTLRVSSQEPQGEYGIVVTTNSRFDTEINDDTLQTLRSLSPGSAALGYLDPSTSAAVTMASDGGSTHTDHRAAIPPQRQLFTRGGYLSGPSSAGARDIALSYLREQSELLGLQPDDIENAIVTGEYVSESNGVTHLYLQQTFRGLPIVNANINVNIMPDGRVLNAGSSFVASAATRALARSVSAPLSAAAALESLAAYFQLPGDGHVTTSAMKQHHSRAQFLQAPVIAHSAIPAELQYVYTSDGQFELAWRLIVETPDRQHWYDANVSATTGEVLDYADWVDHAFYNVYALPLDSPLEGTRSVVVDPEDTAASPFGWHDTNGIAGAEFTATRGNNVFAQEDRDANNSGGFRPDGTPSLAFDFPIDFAQPPENNEAAAITNLFYWNNILHDILFQYGFDEAAGNFQQINYSGQGLGGDPVQADAQDGAGTNNANFSTPPDGFNPRMQMFVWTSTTPRRDGDFDNGIMIHEYGHGLSNRLTGGPGNSGALNAVQSGGMGEGWSDWLTLMLTQQPDDGPDDHIPIGTYALNQPPDGPGIREFPYTFDMAVNPLTYDDFNLNSQVHAAGTIWASALWDLNWLLIHGDGDELPALGFNPDWYAGYSGPGSAGNQLLMQLVLDAMKLQPANPSFLAGRDAILAADVALTGGENQLAIWTAFARRGMGFSADDGGSGNALSVSAAFDLPATRTGTVTLDQDEYITGDTITIQLRDMDLIGSGSVEVIATTTDGDTETVELAELGAGVFTGSIGTAFASSPNDGTLTATISRRVEVQYEDADDGTGNPATARDWAAFLERTLVLDADFSDPAGDPFLEAFEIDNSGGGQWHLSTGRGADPGHSADDAVYFGSGEDAAGGGKYDNDVGGSLFSPVIDLSGIRRPVLKVNHFLEVEDHFDNATINILRTGVPDVLLAANNFSGGLPDRTSGFEAVSLPLNEFAGQQIQTEFQFDSDASVNFEGWYVDDVAVEGGRADPNFVGPTVASITPPAGQLEQYEISSLVIAFSEEISAASAGDADNYQLLEAGPNGKFENGAGDDRTIALAPAFDGAASVTLDLDSSDKPLGVGVYQLTINGRGSIVDLDGNPLNTISGVGGGSDHVHRFDVVYDLAPQGDLYHVPLLAGDVVEFVTATPFDATSSTPLNALDPQLVVLAPNGNPVATDADSRDGKNASVTVTARMTGNYTVQVLSEAGAGEYFLEVVSRTPAVLQRQVFYNNSAYDDPGQGLDDDDAIDETKTPLFHGQAATFANYTSYTKGLNGILIDVHGLVDPSALSADDFVFTAGNDDVVDDWAIAPSPSIAVRTRAGLGGSDRIVLTWDDGALTGTWLGVRLKAGSTGLPVDDIFFFGNAVGDTGDVSTNALVNGFDFAAVRANSNPSVDTTDRWDFNRDARIDGGDLVVARDHATNFATALRLISVPVFAPLALPAAEWDDVLNKLAADAGRQDR